MKNKKTTKKQKPSAKIRELTEEIYDNSFRITHELATINAIIEYLDEQWRKENE